MFDQQNTIFQQSGISPADLSTALEEIKPGQRLSLVAPAFCSAEQSEGVNALFLVAFAAVLSNFGTSMITLGKNNLFSLSPAGTGLNAAYKFKTRQESVKSFSEAVRQLASEGEDGKVADTTIKNVVAQLPNTDENTTGQIVEIMSQLGTILGVQGAAVPDGFPAKDSKPKPTSKPKDEPTDSTDPPEDTDDGTDATGSESDTSKKND